MGTVWRWTSWRCMREMAACAPAVLISLGTVICGSITVASSVAAVEDATVDVLNAEVRQQVDALLAAAGPLPGEGQDAFIDAFAGLLIVYAGDDVQQAAAIADYARLRAPDHADAFETAVDLIWPGTMADSIGTPDSADLTRKRKEAAVAGDAAEADFATAAPPTEGSALAGNGLAASVAVPGNRPLSQFGRSAWGQAGSFGPAGVPAISTARAPNLRTASPIWP